MTASDEAEALFTSAASQDQRLLMISQRMDAPLDPDGRPTDDFTGSWVAAGAIDDEGSARITQAVVTQQDGGTATIEATHVLTGRGDPARTLTLKTSTTLRPIPPPQPNRRVLVEGRWELVEATGAFAGLHADGKLYATITDREVGENREIREITLVRDGRRRGGASLE
jgi:hypothetical protein